MLEIARLKKRDSNHVFQIMALIDNPLIIGHRGAAGLAPENTLASFAAAYQAGVGAVELDVYLVEGELLVFHDEGLERCTNGSGKLQQQSLAYLRSLDAGNQQQIPLLQEVLAGLPSGVGINIELKGRGTGTAVAQLLAMQPDLDVVVSSFRHAELRQFREHNAAGLVAPLFHRWPPAPWQVARKLGAWSVNLSARITTAKRVAKIHAAGYRCYVYTVNDPKLAAQLLSYGVNGIFTDRPDLMQDLVPI